MRPQPIKPQIQSYTRTPVSRPMLVCYQHEWQVCYQARGKLDGRRITAWVYGKESIYFCEVGAEADTMQLPQPAKRPFFDDQFIHTIEAVDSQGVRVERLAGANDIISAHAAWNVLTLNTSHTEIIMRDGSYVIRRKNAP